MAGRLPAGKGDHDFVAEELELRTDTGPIRVIHVLTTELHRRLLEDPPAPV